MYRKMNYITRYFYIILWIMLLFVYLAFLMMMRGNINFIYIMNYVTLRKFRLPYNDKSIDIFIFSFLNYSSSFINPSLSPFPFPFPLSPFPFPFQFSRAKVAREWIKTHGGCLGIFFFFFFFFFFFNRYAPSL